MKSLERLEELLYKIGDPDTLSKELHLKALKGMVQCGREILEEFKALDKGVDPKEVKDPTVD